MGDQCIRIPLGGGRYLPIHAIPSGWRYQTGSSVLIGGNVGPLGVIGGGVVSGTLVFAVTQGQFAQPKRAYRLHFRGYQISFALGIGPKVGGQISTEAMPSFARGQVYRLPRSDAPMPNSGRPFAATQEAGSPTGFQGDFMMASYDTGAYGGRSTCIMFLGGRKGAATSWSERDFTQYKYVTIFDGMWAGSSAGTGFSVVRGNIGTPSQA